MKKAILELELPVSCLQCKIVYYEQTEDSENLICPVLNKEACFFDRLDDCPLKEVE